MCPSPAAADLWFSLRTPFDYFRVRNGWNAEAAWYTARRSPHPVGCFTEPVRLARPLEEYSFTRTYIKATAERRPVEGGRPSPFWAAADHAKTSQDWRYRGIDTDHMILVNKPADLIALLLELT